MPYPNMRMDAVIRKEMTADPGVPVTGNRVQRFLRTLTEQGRATATVTRYGKALELLGIYAPDGVRQGTLAAWAAALRAEGYAARTVNLYLSAANGYLEYAGRRDIQEIAAREQPPADEVKPELTRAEYHRLLQAAKVLDRERDYLLVELFASADLPLRELGQVTVEAAQSGNVTVTSGRMRQMIHLPPCLCRELLDYAGRQGISGGPIFITAEGAPLDRSSVTSAIRRLCPTAKVGEEKANPRCLRKLYMATRQTMENNMALLIEQALDRQLEQEQLTTGWKA